MPDILQKIVSRKREEVAAMRNSSSESQWRSRASDAPPPLDFAFAIRSSPRISLIAEVKRASPSAGVIRDDFDPVSVACDYERAGATCISVLTDVDFFQGSIDYLRAIRRAVKIPLLRKDFIIDELQVFESRAAGADAVLLIAECLSAQQMSGLHDCIVELGMTPLVELYDEENLQAVMDCKPVLVGINNRDLRTFRVDLQRTLTIREQISREVLLVGESGIANSADVQLLERSGVDAILVGESLMRQNDIEAAVRRLMSTDC